MDAPAYRLQPDGVSTNALPSDPLGSPASEGPCLHRTSFSREVLSGIPWAVVSKCALFFVYVGASVVTVRCLGAERFGVYSLCRNIAEYLVPVCSLGLNVALARYIPELLVKKSRFGLQNLLYKTACVQATAAALVTLGLYLLKPYFGVWFDVDFRYYLTLTGIFVAVEVSRNYVNDVFTSMFKVRITSLMSLWRGGLWIGAALLLLPWAPSVQMALLVQIVPFAVVTVYGFALIRSYLRDLDWRSTVFGIGRRRTLRISIPSLLDTLANMLLRKYAEVFFLGVYATPVLVGIYDVGCTLPLMMITFVPMAVQKLFTSGFAEAYARDPNCLGRLISSFYRALMLFVLPVAVFGAFFSPKVIPLLYGMEMELAGAVAGVFFVLHVLPLIYMPLSMAIVAKEKVLNMFPLTLLQIGVNLALDFVLIPRYGVWGAVAAVGGAFAVSAPFILLAVKRLIGGVHFPTAFFIRFAFWLTLLAWGLHAVLADRGAVGLVLAGCIYLFGVLAMVRLMKLVRVSDIGQFGVLRSPAVEKIARTILAQ